MTSLSRWERDLLVNLWAEWDCVRRAFEEDRGKLPGDSELRAEWAEIQEYGVPYRISRILRRSVNASDSQMFRNASLQLEGRGLITRVMGGPSGNRCTHLQWTPEGFERAQQLAQESVT